MKLKKQQSGSSIIVAILVLMVLSVILATSLQTALTSSYQTSKALTMQVMKNENDIALMHAVDYADTPLMTSLTGVFTLSKINPGHEFVVCSLYNVSLYGMGGLEYNTIRWASGTAPTRYGSSGYCDPVQGTDSTYTRRRLTLTQISFRHVPSLLASDVSKGAVATGDVYVVTATTLLPTMGAYSTPAAQQNCLANYMNDAANINSHTRGNATTRRTVAQCLNDLGVPAVSSSKIVIV